MPREPIRKLWRSAEKMDWTGIIGGIATVVAAVGVLLVARQLREMQKATRAQSYLAAVSILQTDKLRASRKRVFKLRATPLPWLEEDVEAGEDVCQAYDVVSQMVRYKLLDEDMVVDHWGPSLRDLWTIVSPLVHNLRTQHGDPQKWDDMEWLAKRVPARQAAAGPPGALPQEPRSVDTPADSPCEQVAAPEPRA